MANVDFLFEILFKIKKLKNFTISKKQYNSCLPVEISDFLKIIIFDFYKDAKDGDYKEKYKNLTKNLDKNSIQSVDNILSKIKLIAENNEFRYSHIFDTKEQKQIELLQRKFHQKIKKINENCYQYKNYFLPLNHFEPSVFYYKHSIDKLNKSKFKNKDIIDVGAYIGDSAIVLSLYTKGNIYSFEPTSEIYDLLQSTLKLNPKCKNIVPVKKGLGAKKENSIIHVFDSGSSINRVFANREYKKETIEITTLDDFVKENNLNNIGLIKVDIEGFEQEFLKGAINTIKSQKPTLLLSIYHFADDFFNIKLIIEDLNLGYKFKIVKPVDGSIKGELLLICEQ